MRFEIVFVFFSVFGMQFVCLTQDDQGGKI